MAILYKLTTTMANQTSDKRSLPPEIGDTAEWNNIADAVFDRTGHVLDGGNRIITRLKIFDSVEDASAWFDTNRITDAGKLSALAAWKTEHNITVQESWYELPTANPGIAGIFG